MADQGQSGDLLWTSELKLELLGPVRLGTASGEDFTPKSRKTRALLVILALSKSAVPRSRIVELLWGDRADDQAKASLRQALYELRQLTSGGYIAASRESVGLGPKRLTTDLALLQRAIADGRADELAEFLDGVDASVLATVDDITPEFDDWLRAERARLTSAIVSGSSGVAEKPLGAGDPALARRIADNLERLDPLDERVGQLGIRADLAAGERTAASRRCARLKARLGEQLGVELAPETEWLLVVQPSPALARAAADDPVPHPKKRRFRLVWIAAGLALLGLVAAGWFLLRPASAAADPTVAVLPFDGIGTSDDNHFAAGVSDEILNLLSHQRRFKVIGRVSSEEVARQRDVLAEARRLGITHLLDGSVQSNTGKLLVIVRLTSTADGAQLWSERYERQAGDIFAVQGDIARSVASRMALSLRPVLPQQTAPEVYDRYLAARQLERDRRESNLLQAQKLLKEAIALDDQYAPAFAELSQVTMLLAKHPASWGEIPYPQARAEAEGYARRAIALDPNLGDAWAALGFLNFSDRRSEAYYAKAAALSPQRADFHRWYAQSLKDNQKYDQAIQEYKRAVAIDPLWGINYDHLVGALLELGRTEEAKAYTKRYFELSTDRRGQLMFKRSIANFQWRLADALRLSRELYEDYPDERQSRFAYSGALATIGERRQALKVIGDDPVGRAALSADWPALGKAAAAAGPDFWESVSDYWSASSMLLASGQGPLLVRLYDQSLPKVRSGELLMERMARIDTVLALRDAGRADEADRLEAIAVAQAGRMPDKGYVGSYRRFTFMAAALDRGDRERGIRMLQDFARTSPQQLALLPTVSLRYVPVFRSLVGDPRFDAVDEHIRVILNAERSKAGLRPISKSEWISDPKTLLTKN